MVVVVSVGETGGGSETRRVDVMVGLMLGLLLLSLLACWVVVGGIGCR